MIVAKRKPFDEIMEMLKGRRKVMVVGCGTCVAVCLAGGEKEVAVLAAELDMARKLKGEPVEISATTLERQCDREYLAELDPTAGKQDAIISMACGVGIQFLAERFPNTPVYPAVDTCGLAVNQDVGWYEERCRSCGRCVLAVHRRDLPGHDVRQGALQRALRRHQPRQLRDQRRPALRLERHLRSAQGPGAAGPDPGADPPAGVARHHPAHPDPARLQETGKGQGLIPSTATHTHP